MTSIATTAEATLAERLQFLRIDQATRQSLREMQSFTIDALPQVLARFYEHIGGFPHVRNMFGAGRMDAAKSAQLQHWRTILSGEFSSDYVASVRRIGLRHAHIGLEPRWYIAAYAFIAEGMVKAFLERPGAKKDETQRWIAAFNKALMLDMDFAMSIYLEEGERARKEMAQKLAQLFETSVSGIVSTVASAATELEHTARSLERLARGSSDEATKVAAAAHQTSVNLTSVAGASEQMGRAVAEIARELNRSTRTASEAASRAEETNATIATLSEAAERIGQVVRLISDIAGKTNLLALNATIEAARAGEAGRGFAVVAQEVKTLAIQTARATEDISQKVGEIQGVTREAVEAIAKISDTIAAINEGAASINAAVEEQSATTQEIARNTGEASAGAGEVSRAITTLERGAQETGAAAAQVVAASGELARQAEHLRHEVSQFLASVRAA